VGNRDLQVGCLVRFQPGAYRVRVGVIANDGESPNGGEDSLRRAVRIGDDGSPICQSSIAFPKGQLGLKERA